MTDTHDVDAVQLSELRLDNPESATHLDTMITQIREDLRETVTRDVRVGLEQYIRTLERRARVARDAGQHLDQLTDLVNNLGPCERTKLTTWLVNHGWTPPGYLTTSEHTIGDDTTDDDDPQFPIAG